MLGTGYERLNMRINSDHTIGKRLTFGQHLALSYDEKLNENNSSGRSQIKHILHSIPYIPVHDPTLAGGFRAPNADDGSDPENPVRIASMDKNTTQGLRLLANAYIELKLLESLRYRFTAGVDKLDSELKTILPIYNDSYNARSQAKIENKQFNNTSTVFTNQLTFDKTIGKHAINAVGVIEQQQVLARSLTTTAYYDDNNLKEINGPSSDNVATRRFETLLYSYLGRVQYEYAEKYLFSASLRRDGSSVFSPNHKWGNFPAAAIGWRISEEPFLKNHATISELKLRASYGVLGFNGIGAYDWQQGVSLNTTAVFGSSNDVIGAFFARLKNPELEWEKTKMWNIGLDFGLLANQITFSMEAYNRRVEDIILQPPLAPSLGYAEIPPFNIGEMKNWGMEFQATYTRATGAFQWDLLANIGITRNKVLKLATANNAIYSGNISDYNFQITKTEAGKSIQGFYGYLTEGIFQSEQEVTNAAYQTDGTAPGDIKFKDLDGNGVINSDDRTYLGSFIPDFNYGLNFNASYRHFDITLFLQGVQGNDIFNLTKFYTEGMLRLFGAGEGIKNAWTPEHTNTHMPRAIDGDPNQNVRTSNRFIEDGSYLRIKNLTVGYSLPPALLTSVTRGSLTKARFYVATQNLLTLTGYSGYDPEVGSRFSVGQFAGGITNGLLTNGIDYGQFPSARAVMLGIQIGF